jgi:FkbM family methyltransferase
MGFATYVRRVNPRLWFYFKFLRYKFYKGEPEIHCVRHLLIKGKLAIDVGCSIGLYARELAKYSAKVVAFEANPRVAEFARLVAPQNVEVVNIGLSSVDGETLMRIPLNRRNNTTDELATIEPNNDLHASPILTEKVQTKRLDGFGYSGCGFIKIDVEGHEEAVLDGAMHLIETQRPVLMIELDDRFNAGIIDRVVERLRGLFYGIYLIFDGQLRPLADLDPLIHSKIGLNFIFIPREDEARIRSNFLST